MSWKSHKDRWSNCDRCFLCDSRKKVVLFRGRIPARVLFIGEAPGLSEDLLGSPFVGPAGKLLDSIIRNAGGKESDVGFTNLIACIPKETKGKAKYGQPPKESILACSKRLNETIALARPQAFVLVGKEAKDWFPTVYGNPKNLPFATIAHPASILRLGLARKPLAIMRVVATLKQSGFFNGKT